MRIALALAFTACISAAHAEKLYSPVYIKQTTGACGDLASLKYRDQLVHENRTEALSGINTMAAMSGECGNAPEGQWMFFDQANGDYVCLRPRLGADCAWVRKSAVGEIVELKASTQKPNCQAIAASIDKSRKFQDELTSRYRSEQPNGVAEGIAHGLMGDMLGMVTGVNGSRVDHAKRCLFNYVSAQEEARRYLVYRACPARFLGLSPRTLEKHRIYGTGPAYRKIGGRVVYAVADLNAWADLGTKISTSDPGIGTVLPAKRHAPIPYAGKERR
jgi:hypothetical protein